MSKFFDALEQAAQERAQRERAYAGPSPAARLLPPPALEPPSRGAEGLDEHLVSLLEPASFEAEQYRALRHVVEQLRKSADLAIVAVSSPDAEDGKTTTAINLAGALAQSPDARVLLVDADLRGAALAGKLGLDDRDAVGLVDAVLHPTVALDAVTRKLPHLNLAVVPAGRRTSTPYEILKSARVGELLADARKRYDYVVCDTPPLVSVPDCRVIGKWVDGFLIVVTAHRTTRKLLDEALHVTDPAKVVGLVFNADDRHLSRGSYASRYQAQRTGWWHRREHSASDD